MIKFFQLILLVCLNQLVLAQQITVYEVNEVFNTGTNPAYTVNISENSLSDVRAAWKKSMNRYKASKLGGKKQITAEKIRIPALSPNPVNIYALTEEIGYHHIKLTAAFMVDSVYISKSKPLENEMVKKIMWDFAFQTTKSGISKQIQNQQKMYTKMERVHTDLVEDSVLLKKNILSYQNSIKKAESALLKNAEKRAAQKIEIEKQKIAIEELKLKLEKVQ